MAQKGNWESLNQQIISCRLCPRLTNWREEVAVTRKRAYKSQEYWGKPVPGFGDPAAQVLIVGLAPGAHGSNRTGRMFTGDSSGNFLYKALHQAGFANQPHSLSIGDDLTLKNAFISAICRCVPPQNKPTTQEIHQCLPFLQKEIDLLYNLKVVVALGHLAFQTCLALFPQSSEKSQLKFSHGNEYKLDSNSILLIASYHPSRQNTQTGRLTECMFNEVWGKVNLYINS